MKTKTINFWTAKRLRNLRLMRFLTQSEFAAKIGVVRSAVSAWESGAKSPSLKHTAILDRIATSAGITKQSLDED